MVPVKFPRTTADPDKYHLIPIKSVIADPKAKEYIEYALEGGNRMHELIGDVLAYLVGLRFFWRILLGSPKTIDAGRRSRRMLEPQGR